MERTAPDHGRRLAAATTALAVSAVALGGDCAAGSDPSPGAHPAAVSAAGVTSSTASRRHVEAFRSVRTIGQVAAPVRLRIPAIDLDAPVVPLSRLPDGTLAVPRRWGEVGWYAAGPLPGEPGPAALLGHVDSRSGPAVFYRLRSLRARDRVDVVGADSRVVRFRVRSTARYPKRHFPTEAVYLPTLEPALRLITCGGDFDPRAGHYVDNYVVTATPL